MRFGIFLDIIFAKRRGHTADILESRFQVRVPVQCCREQRRSEAACTVSFVVCSRHHGQHLRNRSDIDAWSVRVAVAVDLRNVVLIFTVGTAMVVTNETRRQHRGLNNTRADQRAVVANSNQCDVLVATIDMLAYVLRNVAVFLREKLQSDPAASQIEIRLRFQPRQTKRNRDAGAVHCNHHERYWKLNGVCVLAALAMRPVVRRKRARCILRRCFVFH